MSRVTLTHKHLNLDCREAVSCVPKDSSQRIFPMPSYRITKRLDESAIDTADIAYSSDLAQSFSSWASSVNWRMVAP